MTPFVISAVLVTALIVTTIFLAYLRFRWRSPLVRLIEHLYDRQEKVDEPIPPVIQDLERAINFAISRHQDRGVKEAAQIRELLENQNLQHENELASLENDRRRIETAAQEIRDERIYAAAVRFLTGHALRHLMSSLNRGEETVEVIRAASRVSFLLDEPDQEGTFGEPTGNDQTRATENLLGLLDSTLEIMAPLLNQQRCTVHVTLEPSAPADVEISPDAIRRSLFRLILDYLSTDDRPDFHVSVDFEANNVVLTFSESFRPVITLLTDERISRAGGQWQDNRLLVPARVPDTRPDLPPDPAVSALVVTDNELERSAITNRLRLLGVSCTSDFKTDPPDICLVSDENADNFLSIRPYLPETTWILLLNRETIINRPYWIQVSQPVNQTELSGAIEHIIHSRGKAGRISSLVVDDSAANARLLGMQLADLGHPVTNASSGQEALDLVRENRFQVIFMDIQMPDMNGVEATRRIRKDDSRTPVFGLTAHATPQEKQAYRRAGMNDVLIKPVRLDTLKSVLGRLNRLTPRPPVPVPSAQTVEIFDKELALRNANLRPELATELMDILLKSLPEDQKSINDHISNLPELKQAVHKLHGAVRYCGVPRLTRAIEKLEAALKHSDQEQVPLLMNLLNGEITALENWYRDNPDPFSHRSSGQEISQ